jgi:hypothetical protein
MQLGFFCYELHFHSRAPLADRTVFIDRDRVRFLPSIPFNSIHDCRRPR